MQYMQYGCIYVHLAIHMHQVLGAFLNRRQIRVLVLRLATFRTCSPALVRERAHAHSE